MQIILFRKIQRADGSDALLSMVAASEQLRRMICDWRGPAQVDSGRRTVVALPREWMTGTVTEASAVLRYADSVPLSAVVESSSRQNSHLVVSDGRFVTQASSELIARVLSGLQGGVVAVNVQYSLRAGNEKVVTDSKGNLAGFRMLYEDAAEQAAGVLDWPHHLFIPSGLSDVLFPQQLLPAKFQDVLSSCRRESIAVSAVNVGGCAIDLNTAHGLLAFIRAGGSQHGTNGANTRIAPGARIVGRVVLDSGVDVGENVLMVGPSFIGGQARIAAGTVIRSSIIGPRSLVTGGAILDNQLVIHSNGSSSQSTTPIANTAWRYMQLDREKGRGIWPGLSYPRFVKRFADVLVSIIVLVLFAPVFPLIALIIKLTSRGPVFFKDLRQGVGGRPFRCLKFRTMKTDADKMQEMLRAANEADGPQFMMTYDPRVSAVGRFLRETHIDEIPQFVNVFVGQMSVVGPRPSPESENMLCPFWRDTRLLVRPGITGLWQVCRTRQPMKDFQEWIHYDTRYVRELSWKLDSWICWRTAKGMALKFIEQF